MNVWINNPFDSVPGEGVRPHRYIFLARALVAAGHTVVWWTSDFSHVMKKPRVVIPPDPPEPYTVIMLPTLPYARNFCLARMRSHQAYAARWEEEALQRVATGELLPPDMIITSVPPLETGHVAQRMRARWNCLLVADVQDAWPEAFYQTLPLPAALRRRVGRWLFARFGASARDVYVGADWVTGVARTYLAIARKNGAKHVARKPFYLGAEQIARVPRKLEDGSVRLRMVYVGVLGKYHDLPTMIRAARMSPEVEFHLAGTGPDERRLRRMAGGAKNIVFHGYLARQALDALLERMDVGVLPMVDDSFVAVPNKFIDYMSHALPAIICLTGEAQVLMDRYDAGLTYQSGNVASFRATIERILVHREFLPMISGHAHQLALAEFDAARIYPEYVRALESLMIENRSSAPAAI